ncbi:hypothetical protein BKA56DRAFT_608935 [Ilyonectria sp. MPI-CAGE-AT-0026]|nr:hypothetical protein BKA56DRAFT_608935 [Ilyonectria sp. MPI-CAGE-AT-0026]
MEGLGVVANVIAVVDLSVKVASLCLQYAKDVRNAAADIERLHEEVTNLRRISEDVQSLLKSPNGKRLEKSQNLDDALGRVLVRLTELKERLKPSTTYKAISRMGFRALKWPFNRSEVEQLLQEFRRCTQTISLTLQVDQT